MFEISTHTEKTSPSQRPRLLVDYDKYAHFLAESDASEEEKRAFLNLLWSIISECVMLGFHVHPLQQVLGKEDHPELSCIREASNVIECTDYPIAELFAQQIACSAPLESTQSRDSNDQNA